MELLLNLFWFLLTALALLGCRRTNRNSSTLAPSLALSCVLVLLFPVISANDDLYAIQAQVEDFAPSKRTSQVEAGITHHQHGSTVVAFTAHAVTICGSLRILQDLQVRDYAQQALTQAVGLFPDRAPPVNPVA